MYTHSGVRGNEQGPKFNSIYDLHRYDTQKNLSAAFRRQQITNSMEHLPTRH